MFEEGGESLVGLTARLTQVVERGSLGTVVAQRVFPHGQSRVKHGFVRAVFTCGEDLFSRVVACHVLGQVFRIGISLATFPTVSRDLGSSVLGQDAQTRLAVFLEELRVFLELLATEGAQRQPFWFGAAFAGHFGEMAAVDAAQLVEVGRGPVKVTEVLQRESTRVEELGTVATADPGVGEVAGLGVHVVHGDGNHGAAGQAQVDLGAGVVALLADGEREVAGVLVPVQLRVVLPEAVDVGEDEWAARARHVELCQAPGTLPDMALQVHQLLFRTAALATDVEPGRVRRVAAHVVQPKHRQAPRTQEVVDFAAVPVVLQVMGPVLAPALAPRLAHRTRHLPHQLGVQHGRLQEPVAKLLTGDGHGGGRSRRYNDGLTAGTTGRLLKTTSTRLNTNTLINNKITYKLNYNKSGLGTWDGRLRDKYIIKT